jgi:type VI secretion system protein ImpK
MLAPPASESTAVAAGSAPSATTLALRASSRPLIALATQLRQARVDAPALMKQALAAAVARFEREAAAAGCDERTVAAASYVLCVWVDEVAADTPWGEGGAGLLARFHGESDGSVKVLRLLSRLAEEPQRHQALLELFHACLSLGLQGRLRTAGGQAGEGARELETLRRRVFLTLAPAEPSLSPPWHSALPARGGPWRRYVLAGLLALALLALGVYTASHLLLAERVDRVFASMQQLSPVVPSVDAPSSGASAPALVATPRLAPRLAPDVAAGLLTVRDEPHRSVITLAADRLFTPASTQLTAEQAALLDRVAAAMSDSAGRSGTGTGTGSGGKVLVIGHTDGRDARTARWPSAWHQSQEWAAQVAGRLRPALGEARVAAEGAGDLDTRGGSDVPLRRVEIVLYP